MNVQYYQACRTAEGWQPVKVQSSSEPNTVYTVQVNPWGADDENICECKSYLFRGSCKHQSMARDTICGWSEQSFTDAIQTDSQRRGMICPECNGPTKWLVEVIE